MKPGTLAKIAVSCAAAFASVLVAIMISVSMDTPAAAPFDANFSLIDDRGRPVDKTAFKGHPSLVYFGYTHCPEACPTTLFEVADWLNALGDQGADLRAYFFSIDPERDTQAVMHDYVTAFSPRIIGVTGKPDEMKKVSQGWFIHAERQPGNAADYHMSHTVSLMMIGADGRLKGILPYGTDRNEALSRIREALLPAKAGA